MLSEEEKQAIEQLKQENKLTASQIYQIQQEAYYKGYADRDKIAINICKNGCKKDYEIELLKKQIDLMSEEILKLDIEKSKFEYDHARIYDTSEFIKQYFKNKVNELEKEELLKTIF